MHYFPDLFDKLKEIEDYRKKKEYELTELIFACIAMFLFKEGSRNAFNNERQEERFKKNYQKIFKVRFPHMDTVNLVMQQLEEEQLEKLKTELVSGLIEKKVFRSHKLLGKYYRVVIDGTHVMNVKEGHCEHCLHRTSKKTGKVTYFHNVLEAKLVSKNGFCISLGTEWIENPKEYNKQDCEQKAFVRLARKLKKDYPRLPICIVADGLYPNRTFFKICTDYNWNWLVTFKDGNLPTVWEEVIGLQKIIDGNTKQEISSHNGQEIHRNYRWIGDIDYCGFSLNWFECVERKGDKSTRFVYISNINVDYEHVIEMTKSGRMRCKIENEGFNIQKNKGYNLGHKYSRVLMKATKNYYQCMQIAHLINQLFELGSLLQELLIRKITIRHLWKMMLSEMSQKSLDMQILDEFLERRIQIRY